MSPAVATRNGNDSMTFKCCLVDSPKWERKSEEDDKRREKQTAGTHGRSSQRESICGQTKEWNWNFTFFWYSFNGIQCGSSSHCCISGIVAHWLHFLTFSWVGYFTDMIWWSDWEQWEWKVKQEAAAAVLTSCFTSNQINIHQCCWPWRFCLSIYSVSERISQAQTWPVNPV